MKIGTLFCTTAMVAAASLAAGTLPAAGAPPESGPSRPVSIDRATASYEAMQNYLFVDDGSSLYLERFPLAEEDRQYSYEWPFSQAHIATLDLAGIEGKTGQQFEDDLADRGVGQEQYWNAAGGTTGLPGYDSYPRAPFGDGGDMFYDDNEWVALAKVQQYLMNGDKAALERAKEIFELVDSGWDTDPSHPAPGGVFWTQAPWSTDRNTVSTMPGAQLGARLYEITGDKHYLDTALKYVEWTDEYLLAPNNLYWDNIKLDGSIDKTQWSYNQGVPIGTYALLYQATGDKAYLNKAKAIAEASYSYYVEEGRLLGQPAYFNSIYFKNLLLLESITGGTNYRGAMQDYADTVWNEVRDSDTGLFAFGDDETELLEQAAMVQIYATLAWPTGRTSILY